MQSLLTAHGLVKWLAELSGGEAIGVLVGGMAATVWLIVKGAVIGFRKKTKEETAKADVPVLPMPVLAEPQPPSNEAELQAARAQRMATEAALLDTQLAIRRVRAAMDEQVRDSAKAEGVLMAANVLAKAENERLTAELAAARARIAELELKGADLVEQMRRERAEPLSPPQARKLRSVPPLPKGFGRER